MTERRRLPWRRPLERLSVEHRGVAYLVDPGIDPRDGSLREVFISPDWSRGSRVGSDADHLGADVATLISVSLQRGVPLEEMRHSLARHDGRPMTLIGAALDAMAAWAAEGGP